MSTGDKSLNSVITSARDSLMQYLLQRLGPVRIVLLPVSASPVVDKLLRYRLLLVRKE